MRRLIAWTIGATTLLALVPLQSSAVECGLSKLTRHIDKDGTWIYTQETGRPALYFTANMDVNTDGSGRSYHPDDPRGQSLALNNIANATKHIYDASGKIADCSPIRGECFNRYISTFEASRSANYPPKGHPRVTTDGMIPWKMDPALGWKRPCTTQSGPFRGYFVSQTSLSVDPSKDECDQARYLDSLVFNAIVRPSGAVWKSQGVATDDGDLVVTRDLGTNRIAFAINGDAGPRKGIGEGTIALSASLKGVKLTGSETYSAIKGLARPAVQYLIFPRDDIRRIAGPVFSQGDIDREAAKLFAEWGGIERLDACRQLQ